MTRFLSCYGPRKRAKERKEKKGQRGEGERLHCTARMRSAKKEGGGKREKEYPCCGGVYNWLPRVVPWPTSQLCISRTIAGGPSCFMPRTMIHAIRTNTTRVHVRVPRESALSGIQLHLEIMRRVRRVETRHAAGTQVSPQDRSTIALVQELERAPLF